MIFASLGTTNIAFTRMAKAIDDLAATTSEEVIIQTGHTNYDYKHATAFDFCTKIEMQDYIDRADILVLQGGWGAISEAMEKRKRIVAMPRYDVIEHIHDQVQLVRKLDSLGCVVGVFDEKDMAQKINEAYSHDFKQLKRGNAEERIREKLHQWFK